MTRIDATFKRLAEQRRTALIPFVTCGDPSLDSAADLLHALVEGGADLIEVGVPFSDPQADGPVIQRSSERALARGVGLPQVLDVCRQFRQRDQTTPLVLMGYLNPVEMYGDERFATDAASAGVDGVLLVDSPPEESDALRAALNRANLQLILLAAPTTDDERLALISKAAQGYLYYVSFAGVTGAGSLRLDAVEARLAKLRALAGVPVAVGFGIKDATTAAQLGAMAEGVVVGSALVDALSLAGDSASVRTCATEFLRPIRDALDAKR